MAVDEGDRTEFPVPALENVSDDRGPGVTSRKDDLQVRLTDGLIESAVQRIFEIIEALVGQISGSGAPDARTFPFSRGSRESRYPTKRVCAEVRRPAIIR